MLYSNAVMHISLYHCRFQSLHCGQEGDMKIEDVTGSNVTVVCADDILQLNCLTSYLRR